MPTSVLDLLETVPIDLAGSVRWNYPVESNECGIYIVSLSKNPSENSGILKSAPINIEIVKQWSQVCGLKLDNTSNPSVKAIAQRISEFWLPDESILYIGQTSRPLSIRVDEYYKHELGDSSPHSGGRWLKTLSNLRSIWVHYAETPTPEKVEEQLIETFVNGVSSITKTNLRDSIHPFPFANLELYKRMERRKIRKRHGIGNQIKKLSSKYEFIER